MGAECVAPVLLHQFQNNRGRTSGCLRASFEKNSPRNAPKSLRSNRSLPKQVVSGAAPTSQGVHCNAPALNCCWTLGHQPFTGHLKPSKKNPHPARVIKREGEDAKENATMDKEVELEAPICFRLQKRLRCNLPLEGGMLHHFPFISIQ